MEWLAPDGDLDEGPAGARRLIKTSGHVCLLRRLDKPCRVVSPSLMNRRLVLIAGTLLLAGCVTPRVGAPEGASFELLEPVYTVSAGPDVRAIRVAANGCTTKEDFAFFVEKTPAGARVAFGRKRLDRCQSFAQGRVELTFTWAELGLDGRAGVFLANPVVAWTGPGAL